MGDAVAMTDEDVFVIDMIGSAMPSGFVFLFVAFKEEIASAIAHIDAVAVQIRAINRLTATYSHTVVALATLTTIIPGYKEIIPTVMLEDKRCLNGIGAREV